MKFQRVKAAAKVEQIPFVAEEVLTSNPGFLVTEEAIANIEAALEAAEGKGDVTAIQAQLDTVSAELATAKTDLSAANGTLTAIQTELATAKTELATAQAEATTWKEKAIEFGAKPADQRSAETPGADNFEDDNEKALASLSHNQKADRLLG